MSSKKLWGGRFQEKTSTQVEMYTQSQTFDRLLAQEDIRGSQAHARMLAAQGIISHEEAGTLITGLENVLAEITKGTFIWKAELEDVHMNIESRLTELVGPVGGKLHTGRSRNDQVALDVRLYVAGRLKVWQSLLTRLITVLTIQAEKHKACLLPGCTHLQPAQPVSLAQHLLAYAQMFKRDHQRTVHCLERTQVSPLGAAALAGTTYDINPGQVAQELGFPAHFANSMDAVSDRDFLIEAVFISSLTMAHLSRLCEEIIIWANPAFGFVILPDAFATGSSIMPQKKNPDVAELMRGKTGRVYGALTTLLTLIKGLPLSYNRDMQEDKEPFFDADHTVSASLSIMAEMLCEMQFSQAAMEKALNLGFLNATELADHLVAKGIMPFREAHHAAGSAVAYAEKKGKQLQELSLTELQQFAGDIKEDVFTALTYEAAVARREAAGGTGPLSVQKQLEDLKAWLEKTESLSS